MISVDAIAEYLSAEGYEVELTPDPDVFRVTDLESGLQVTCALQDNVLFNTLPCFQVAADGLSSDLMRKLLDADNGISTSSFQLFEVSAGDYRVALTNFCKLQDLGAEDHDDILSCLSFLFVDVVAAKQLLSEYV